MTLIVAACDKPEAKPPTNIEKDEKADTDTVPKGKSGGDSAGETDADGAKSGEGGEEAAPASFAFGEATVGSRKVAFTASTYSLTVDNTNKPAGDVRNIRYTSSNEGIATVNQAGVVTFKTVGTVIITATKAAEGDHVKATASYELTITKMKPANKAELVAEITRAMDAHGNEVNLNYIDVSDITDMSWLFSSHASGYGRQAFNGDISKWDVSKVTTMFSMFLGATSFDQDISGWKVAKVTNMGSMFNGATAFNQDISGWNVKNVENMIAMFLGATSFKQNLNVWVEKINPWIKRLFWQNTHFMFKDSGLANKLPSWCVTDCKNRQG